MTVMMVMVTTVSDSDSDDGDGLQVNDLLSATCVMLVSH